MMAAVKPRSLGNSRDFWLRGRLRLWQKIAPARINPGNGTGETPGGPWERYYFARFSVRETNCRLCKRHVPN